MEGDQHGMVESLAGMPLLARMLADAAERPEHRLLDPLVGDWRLESQWEVTAGGGWHHHTGSTRNRWILDRRAIESCNLDADGSEVSRFYLAFDPTAGAPLTVSSR